MKKKIFAALLCIVMCLSLAGCGAKPENVEKALKKEGYSVTLTTNDDGSLLMATKDIINVITVYFATNKDDADKKKADYSTSNPLFSVKSKGNIVYFATTETARADIEKALQ